MIIGGILLLEQRNGPDPWTRADSFYLFAGKNLLDIFRMNARPDVGLGIALILDDVMLLQKIEDIHDLVGIGRGDLRIVMRRLLLLQHEADGFDGIAAGFRKDAIGVLRVLAQEAGSLM